VSGSLNSIGAYTPHDRDASRPPGVLTLAEVAARCGLSEAALRGRAWRGKLPVVRAGGQTFVAEDVADALAEAYRLLRKVAQRAREQATAEHGAGAGEVL
jgi:hypothetical protein